MTQETSSGRALSSRIVDAASTVVAGTTGFALLIAAIAHLAQPVAIEPMASPPSPRPAIAQVRVARQAELGAAVGHAGSQVVPRTRRSAHFVSPRQHGTPLAVKRMARPLTLQHLAGRSLIVLHAPRGRPQAPVRVHVAAPIASRPQALARVLVPTQARLRPRTPVASASRYDGARVAVARTRVARPSGAGLFAIPEPPLDFDARPEFVGPRADPLAARTSLEGVRVRGRTIVTPSPRPAASNAD